jgi:hypothetical protein
MTPGTQASEVGTDKQIFDPRTELLVTKELMFLNPNPPTNIVLTYGCYLLQHAILLLQRLE